MAEIRCNVPFAQQTERPVARLTLVGRRTTAVISRFEIH